MIATTVKPDRDTVAVVGVGCRFPGADSPEAFWRMLAEGRDVARPFTPERLVAEFHDPDPSRIGHTHATAGYFLDDIEAFDAPFFGITPREAQFIDPMFRLLLETTWEALEDGGILPASLAGDRVGVFVAASATDFLNLQIWSGKVTVIDAYTGPGTLHSMASGRLSHFFGFEGPSMTIDTACSSSLVALHLATASLRRRECDLAVVGGATLTLSPDFWINLSQARMISADGRCKTFDAAADGYGRGEGGATLILKRLEDAVADGNRVLAVVRGSAVRHDGRSSSITAPNGRSQRAVIKEALTDAGISPDEVSYIEAHGTGTPLGDPIEMAAIQDVFTTGSRRRTPLFVGSVKTNVGHLEAAAGMAGLVKVILSFEYGGIPAHLHLRTLNPQINLDDGLVRIPTRLEPWPRATRIAGISSFGLSGTNAHAVLEAGPDSRASSPEHRLPVIVTVSGRTESALRQAARRYAAVLSAQTDPSPANATPEGSSDHPAGTAAAAGPTLADAAYTANVGRTHFRHRAHVVARDREEAARKLTAIADGAPSAMCGESPVRLAFLYPGQGAQRAGVGRALYQTEPAFKDALDRCAEAMSGSLDRPLLDLLFDEEQAGLLDQTIYTQPALFAMEYALTELWRSFGVRADAVIGHSVGAYAAACAAGVFALETAAEAVIARGRLMARIDEPGAMYAAFASEETVAKALSGLEDRVAIAAVNAADAVTFSGAAQPAAVAAERLREAGVVVKQLRVSHAFHSPLMDPILADLESLIDAMPANPPRIAFVSDLTGELAGPEVCTGAYWRRHSREPVRFADGLTSLRRAGCGAFLEVGPGDTLAGLAKVTIGPDAPVIVSLGAPDSDESEPERIHAALGALYGAGVAIDWSAYHRRRPGRTVRFPTYAFERTVYVNRAVQEGRDSLRALARGGGHPAHGFTTVPYAGTATWLPSGSAVFSRRLTEADLTDHRLFGRVVVPGAFWLAAAASAVRQMTGTPRCVFTDVVFTRPLTLGQEDEPSIRCTLTARDGGGWTFEAHSADREGPDAQWHRHAGAQVRAADDAVTGTADRPRPATHRTVPGEDFYAETASRRLELGPSFRWIEQVAPADQAALAVLRPPSVGGSDFPQPGFLDACVQAVAGALPEAFLDRLTRSDSLLIPVTVDRVYLNMTPFTRAECHVEIVETDARTFAIATITVRDGAGETVVRMDGVRLETVNPVLLSRGSNPVRRYRTTWREREGEESAAIAPPGGWLLWGSDDGLVSRVSSALVARGQDCVRLTRKGDTARLHLPDGQVEEYNLTDPDIWRKIPVDRRHLVYLHTGGLDADPLAAQETLLGDLLRIIQECDAPIWVVTRGAQAVDTEPTSPELAPLWGLARVLGTENPERLAGLVDLDPQPPADEAEALAALLCQPGPSTHFAHRAGTWYVPRLEPVHTGGTLPVRRDGTYLVTGGAGGVGREVVRWLVGRGAGRVIVCGRSASPAVELPEGPVTYTAADVTDAEQVASLLRGLADDEPPLRGIIHAAGTLNDALLPEQSWQTLAVPLGPKVAGAWHLHRFSQDLDLDFFILFSSVAGLLGSPGQAGYAAANAFLDSLAAHRRAAGLPATSIAWGPWAGDGMVSESGAAHRLAAVGLTPMLAEHALAQLDPAATGPAPVIAVADADWARWRRTAGGRSMDDLLADRISEAQPKPQTADVPDWSRLDPASRRERLVEIIRSHVASTMNMAPGDVPIDTSLTALGLDSLMGLELKHRAESQLGIRIPAALLLQGPSVLELADHLAPLLDGETPPEPSEERLDELDESDLDRLLAEYDETERSMG